MTKEETKLSISTKGKLFELKRKFNIISDASYTYSQLKNDYPFKRLESDEEADEYIAILEKLLDEIRKAINE